MTGDASEAPDNPGVIAPPPLIYASALAVGLVTRGMVGRGVSRNAPAYPVFFLSRVLGWLLIVVGVGIGALGFREMRRAGTNVDPREPTTAIVTEGPYRFTRNPLYLGMTLIYSGIAVRANAFPAVLLLPAVLFVMQRGVIEREERYLERKFGDEYLRYKTRVRRWL
ncbi:MAG TPA: isoprenylcysteine carboxylmethyltransferase family protein [Rubrobacteraceae bacterium]|nr:isoprenylcysteine carboxylmethyltransferase family protein [Rubrobacteraceae bacterium]